MKIEIGKAYRCHKGLAGIPTVDGECVVVKSFKRNAVDIEVELEGQRAMPVPLSMFRYSYFEEI